MLKRRALLSGVASMWAFGPAFVHQAVAQSNEIHERFIAQAFSMRDWAVSEGDQAFGAIVVKNGQVVGLGPSRVVTNWDATAHAEMEALCAAGRTLGTHDLSDCILYTTSPPCRMCETAAYWGNIERVYTGRSISDRGKPGYGC